VSFWLNLVALRLVLFLVQEGLSPTKDQDWSAYSLSYLAWALFAHGIVLIWQIVGVLRAAEHHYKETGSLATSWGAQLALVPALFLSGTYVLQAWQQTQPLPDKESYLITMERERAGNYKMRIVPGILAVEFTGTIELGVTRKLRDILESGFPAKLILLDSVGGNIYEARGMAKLMQKYQLNTHIARNCTSACTSAFMGGVRRSMLENAKLGFHQYRMDSSYTILNVDPKKEQERDLAFFGAQGVSPGFLENIFDQPSTGMWFPTPDALLEANVVHTVIRPKQAHLANQAQ